MKRSWIDTARAEEIRSAARGWRRLGAIDAATLAAIESEYPDPRVHINAVWSILVFALVSVAVLAVFGSLGWATAHWAPRCLVFAAMLAAATETLRRSRLAGTGSDAAASFWTVVFLASGFGLFLVESQRVRSETALTLTLLFGGLACAATCWRWGYAPWGAVAAAMLFGFLARFEAGRLLWILAAPIGAVAASLLLDRASLAPPHRRAMAGVLGVCALALYAAVNRYSVDHRLIEELGAVPQRPADPAFRLVSNAATAAVPILLLLWGLRTRRMLILDLGAVCAALSLVTLSYYLHLDPLWAVLVVGGGALLAGALWLNRYLHRSPNGEKSGFTAIPLRPGRSTANVEGAAVLLGFAPRTPSPSGTDRGDFTGGGGGFGGGGATGSF